MGVWSGCWELEGEQRKDRKPEQELCTLLYTRPDPEWSVNTP